MAKNKRIIFIIIICLVLNVGFANFCSTVLASQKDSWRLDEAIGLPDWVSISGEHRTRYETLNRQFRANSSGSDQVLSLRTLASIELRFNENFHVRLEMQDSRAELADSGSRMNSTIVNSAELLEANLVWEMANLFQDGSQTVLRGGRLTMDIGSRRFIARNRFRNVIQAFTGVDMKWTAKDGTRIQAIWTTPVNRKPSGVPELLQNEASFDEETANRILWGIFAATPNLPWGDKGEFYIFGLYEEDGPDFRTRDREVYTPGMRLYRSAKKGQFDYEWESMLQFGAVRATDAPTDTNDLDHFAHFHHIQAGYTFEAPWSPRLYFEYDFASGDGDPNDDSNGRFERLFGPNVPEFGPTSIYTAFVRANISSPGVRLQVRPNKSVFAYLSYRAFWLASDTDGWRGASGLRDTTGNSGGFLGHHFFMRVKWRALPNIRLEGGLAYRIDGNFQENVPKSPRQGNSTYFYSSITLSF